MKRPESTLAALLLVAALSVAVVVADIDGFPYNDGPGLCALMDNNYPARSTSPFSSGANTSASVCLAGTAKTDAKSDVLRVDNLFRYLIGLDPAPNYESAQDKRTQECALMCAANTGLNHQWPSTANCFTADGDAGCRSSNLAMGRSNPSDIMSQYIQDNNVANLGHRRWIFSPTLDKISFGAIGVYSSLYWAWPPEGYFPLQMLTKTGAPQRWNYATPDNIVSVSNCQIMFGSTNVLSGTCTMETSGFGVYKSVMLPVGSSATASGCYTVSFSYNTGTETKSVSYTVTLYDCTKTGTGGGLTNCPANSAVRTLPTFNPGNPVVIVNPPVATTAPVSSTPKPAPAPVPSGAPIPASSAPVRNTPLPSGAPTTSAIGSFASSLQISSILIVVCGLWALFA